MHKWLTDRISEDLVIGLYFWLFVFIFWIVFGGGWGYLVVHLNLPLPPPHSPLRLPS